jgi:hypothetical protein
MNVHVPEGLTGNGDAVMALADKEAELGLLLASMQNRPSDWHELYEVIRQKLNEMRAYGMPLPEDLVAFEQDLEAEFEARGEAAKRQVRIDQVIERRSARTS